MEAKLAYESQVAASLGALAVGRPRRRDLAEPMQANREKIKAFDKMMVACTNFNGLKHFISPRPLAPLPQDVVRFTVNVADLPIAIRELSGDRALRSCLLNKLDNSTCIEMTLGSRPSIWCLADMGSVGWPGKIKTYQALDIRGNELWCYAHRRIRNRELALINSGALIAKLEFQVIGNFLFGPFSSYANGGDNGAPERVLLELLRRRLVVPGLLPVHLLLHLRL